VDAAHLDERAVRKLASCRGRRRRHRRRLASRSADEGVRPARRTISSALTPDFGALSAAVNPANWPFLVGTPARWANVEGRHGERAVECSGLSPTIFLRDPLHSSASFLATEGTHARSMTQRMGHSTITVRLNRCADLFSPLEEPITDPLDTRIRQFFLAFDTSLAHAAEAEKGGGSGIGR
jgi:hypothetical protein